MSRLDQHDAYLLTFTAQLLELRRDPRTPGHAWLRLDRSAFYPTSGGQSHDTGTLSGHPVQDVAVDDGEVWHLLATPPDDWLPGVELEGRVDAERRARHRQRHTAQHLLSQAFLRVDPGFETKAVSLSSADLTVDFAGEPDEDAVQAAERLANDAAYAGWAVRSLQVDEGELAAYPLRRPPKVRGLVRLVAVGPSVEQDPASAWELSACGGTHVRNTAEVAPIVVLRSERVRGGLSRITFRAGWEALEDHRAKHRLASEAARLLSSAVGELPEKVGGLLEEAAGLRRALVDARAAWASERAARLLAEHAGGAVSATLDESEAELLAPLAEALAARGATAVLALRHQGKAELLLVSGAGVDVRPALQAALPHVEGRGGGRPERAQGAGPRLEGLEAGLAVAVEALGGRE